MLNKDYREMLECLLEENVNSRCDWSVIAIKIDARAGVAFKDLSVELYVRNLTNADDFTWRGLTNANSGIGFKSFGSACVRARSGCSSDIGSSDGRFSHL